MDQQIAYLGLGIMGGAMAANLAKAGFPVLGWNRTPGRPGAKLAESHGARITETADDAVKQADVVFLCLSDVADIEEMLLGDNSVSKVAKPGTLFIDMSTTGPECAQKLHHELSQQHLRFLDAPVSGGDVGAKNATLTIMVGGDNGDFQEARPLFDCLGKSVTYCGPSGSGQAVKLCNQILCAVNMVAITESIHLAKSVGVDPQLVVDICSTGAGGSWALTNLGPKIIQEDRKPGFKIKDMLKDLRLVEELLTDDQALPGTELAMQNFQRAMSDTPDGGDQGTQAMIRAYRQKSS